jgi:PAT family beta-lactamase induction signal transducer AmpG
MKPSRIIALQCLFGWLNLALAIPSIYLMFGMPLVMRQHGWSGMEIGLFQLAGLPAIFKFMLAVPVQRIQIGKNRFVYWLLTLGILLLALFWYIGRQNLIEERTMLFVLTFAISILVTWMDIPLNALAVQWLPRTQQLYTGSIRAAVLFLGAIIGGGVMLIVQTKWGWQAPFVLMTIAVVIGLLPLLLFSTNSEAHTHTAQLQQPGLLTGWTEFFNQPGAKQWTLLLLTSFPFIGAVWLYLKPLMLDQGMPMQQVAWLVGIAGGVTGAIASLIAGRLIPVLGTARAIVLYLFTALLALILLTVTIWAQLGTTWLIISTLAIAATMGAVSALMFGLTMFFTRKQQNASDYGLQSSLFVVTRLTVPMLAGILLDRVGQHGMLLGLIAGVLVAFILAWRVRHQVSDRAQTVMAEDTV